MLILDRNRRQFKRILFIIGMTIDHIFLTTDHESAAIQIDRTRSQPVPVSRTDL
jgi:hypothetical protein